MDYLPPPKEDKQKIITKIYKNKHVFDNLPKSKKDNIITKIKIVSTN
jgi:hypothetical protein